MTGIEQCVFYLVVLFCRLGFAELIPKYYTRANGTGQCEVPFITRSTKKLTVQSTVSFQEFLTELYSIQPDLQYAHYVLYNLATHYTTNFNHTSPNIQCQSADFSYHLLSKLCTSSSFPALQLISVPTFSQIQMSCRFLLFPANVLSFNDMQRTLFKERTQNGPTQA